MAPLSDADRAQWAFGTGLPHQPCPRQNGFAERMIGLIWRRDIDHIVVLTEALAPDLAILLYYNSSEHIGYWIKMRRSLARFSGLESSVHTRCSAAWSALLKRKLQRQPRQSLLVPGAIATGRRRKPFVAGGAEAGDRRGVFCAGLVGVNGCSALRRECEPGTQLAEALSRRAACAGRRIGSAIDPCDSYGGDDCCRHGAVDRHGDDRD
jgi:hypothetical protein